MIQIQSHTAQTEASGQKYPLLRVVLRNRDAAPRNQTTTCNNYLAFGNLPKNLALVVQDIWSALILSVFVICQYMA